MYNNYFVRLLGKDFEVEVTPENPDIIIYSWEGREFEKYNCIRIYYTPENWRMPMYRDCDFSLSFEYWDDPRNLRMPNYVKYKFYPPQLDKSKIDIQKLLDSRTKFCSMVVSNPNTPERNDFFHKLSKYKQVDSGGKHLNNVGGRVENKYEFIGQYKFNICFENAVHPGYTTEKLVEAMGCMTMPLYWGNPLIHFEFNPKSFFNCADYYSDDDMIEDIIEHDQKPELYYKKFLEPWFEDDIPNQFFDNQRVRKFLYDIVMRKDSYVPIAKNRYKKYFYFPVGYQINMMRAFLRKLTK
jgi:hypothetical protein